MLTQDDLAAGVAQGIITDTQAAALGVLAADRARARAAELGDEERFRFMRGFNDFFFASGVLLFGFGTKFFAGPTPIGNLIAAAMMWALAELLVAHMRLVLPGILLALLFVTFVYVAVPVDWVDPAAIAQPRRPGLGYYLGGGVWFAAPAVTAVKGLVAAAAALLFYARFRLPFALLLVAGSLVLTVRMATQRLLPDAPEAAQAAVLLLCGLTVFATAMTFDVSDRERVTRQADCAFWLHLLAAPLIVHSLIALTTPNAFQVTGRSAATIIAVVAVLTLVAVAIDRRALLVSTLTYLGVAISYALEAASVDQAVIFSGTLLVLGATVLALGVGWLPLRRRLIPLLSPDIAKHLPPVVPAA